MLIRLTDGMWVSRNDFYAYLPAEYSNLFTSRIFRPTPDELLEILHVLQLRACNFPAFSAFSGWEFMHIVGVGINGE
jgi:hypothetical protein